MNAQDQKPAKVKSPLWPLWLLLKIILVIIVLFAVGVVILANMGGNSDALKTMIEDYISDTSGMDTQIGKLNNIAFYPDINIDFEDLRLRKQVDAPAAMTVGLLNVRVGFWDALHGSTKIKNVSIQDFRAEKGLVTQEALNISKLEIEDAERASDAPKLVLTGTVGDKPLTASSTVAAYGTGEERTYDLGEERQINAQVGDLKLAGFMSNPSLSEIDFKDISVTQAGQNIVSGQLTLAAKGDGRKITGDLSSGKGSRVQPDVFINPQEVTGKIDAPQLHVEDIAPLMGGVQYLTQLLPQKNKAQGISFGEQNVDLRVQSPNIFSKGEKLAEQDVQITIQDGALKAEAKGGKLFDGKTDWIATVTPEGSMHRLNMSVNIDDMPAENVLSAQSGKSNVSANVDGYAVLTSAASTWEGFKPALQGDIIAVVDRGKINAKALDVWGNGLGMLLIPGNSSQNELDITCSILDTKVSNSVATFETLALDAKRVVIDGTGTYNIEADRLNIKLHPKTKDVNYGDISATVNITGPLSKPAVRADAVDLSRKAANLVVKNVDKDVLDKVESTLGFDVFKMAGIEREKEQPAEEVVTEPAAAQPVAAATTNLCQPLEGLSGGNLAQKLHEKLASQAAAQ
jgi:hypothetical protein